MEGWRGARTALTVLCAVGDGRVPKDTQSTTASTSSAASTVQSEDRNSSWAWACAERGGRRRHREGGGEGVGMVVTQKSTDQVPTLCSRCRDAALASLSCVRVGEGGKRETWQLGREEGDATTSHFAAASEVATSLRAIPKQQRPKGSEAQSQEPHHPIQSLPLLVPNTRASKIRRYHMGEQGSPQWPVVRACQAAEEGGAGGMAPTSF